jgi:hypothetical protein
MALAENRKNGTGIDYTQGDTTERNKVHENSSDFFTDAPSEYIDSSSILPASESREQLNHFFDETTSTTPAENAEILQQESARGKGEPETFGETQVGKFLKNLFSKD